MTAIVEYIFLLVHIIVWLWSVGGMLEWLLPDVPWKPYSNPDFPHWLLFFQWLVVIVASTGFLIGYFAGWKWTPRFAPHTSSSHVHGWLSSHRAFLKYA